MGREVEQEDGGFRETDGETPVGWLKHVWNKVVKLDRFLKIN